MTLDAVRQQAIDHLRAGEWAEVLALVGLEEAVALAGSVGEHHWQSRAGRRTA